jgi:hypothetical protein
MTITTCSRCGKRLATNFAEIGIHTCTPPAVWPTWPFTRLTPAQMKELEAKMKKQRINDADEALL